ncbi:FecR family protein [Pedobacter frigidisoli]|uniref:FecR family protein n=1 Tax=Pedobacter frigidisoli TaxID=2530455 RepID=UPI00292FB7BA|nr:FecR domain-containing protein [Pedobacter frigidisoli]
MDKHYYKLIEDFTKKNISSEDLADLMLWVDKSKENQQIFREVVKSYEAADSFFEAPQKQQQSWAKIQQRLILQEPDVNVPVNTRSFKQLLLIAAAIIVTFSVSIIYFQQYYVRTKAPIVFHEIYNPKGQKRLVTMPDGSSIYLNGDSKIKYAENFDKGKRIVYLEGEAFFDVQHRPKQPFIVYSGKVATSVLGTSFNVNWYNGADKVKITVKTGKVGVVFSRGKTKHVTYLLPNEQLSVLNNGESIKKSNLDADEIDSWRVYKMVFYDQPLSEIMKVIEREYDVDITFKNQALKHIKLTTKFDKCSVIQLMDMIAQLSNLKYTIYGKKITIY